MSKTKLFLTTFFVLVLIVPQVWSEMTLDQIMTNHLQALGGWE
jgi:hypothetical protein